MRARRTRFAVIAIAAAGGILACGPPTHVRRYRPDLDGSYDPLDLGAPGGSGGDQPGGQGGTTASGGGTGGGGDQGGDSGQGGGDSPDSAAPDSAGAAGAGGVSATGGISGTGGDTVDAAADVAGPSIGGAGGSLDAGAAGGGGNGGAGGNGGTGGTSGNGGTGGMSGAGGPIVGPGGTALCDPDRGVIVICKQLEPACENCPDKSIWNECFDMAAAGNDKACARYAIQNNCKVDTGGNTCGSLNCQAKGCNKSACTTAQGNGDTTKCAPLLATCPCQ